MAHLQITCSNVCVCVCACLGVGRLGIFYCVASGSACIASSSLGASGGSRIHTPLPQNRVCWPHTCKTPSEQAPPFGMPQSSTLWCLRALPPNGTPAPTTHKCLLHIIARSASRGGFGEWWGRATGDDRQQRPMPESSSTSCTFGLAHRLDARRLTSASPRLRSVHLTQTVCQRNRNPPYEVARSPTFLAKRLNKETRLTKGRCVATVSWYFWLKLWMAAQICGCKAAASFGNHIVYAK